MKNTFAKHGLVAVATIFLTALVWQVNETWSPDMRLWKALGGASFFLLWFALILGPLAVLFTSAAKLLPLRREIGIWFFLIAALHSYLILDGWVRWSMWEFFGYQYFAEIDAYLRVESGFGVSNLAGAIALFFAFVLAATSFQRVIDCIGIRSWKWLHMFVYVIFFLSAVHVVYYAFMHFDPSLNRVVLGLPTEYPENPLRYWYLGALVSVVLLQTRSFCKLAGNQD
jgi:sulfoxide reductase heme-binding subunit YedZ